MCSSDLHVAAEFPQLCEAETEAFGRLLGTPVRRLATIAHGDGICTTHVTCTSADSAAENNSAAESAAPTAHTVSPKHILGPEGSNI